MELYWANRDFKQHHTAWYSVLFVEQKVSAYMAEGFVPCFVPLKVLIGRHYPSSTTPPVLHVYLVEIRRELVLLFFSCSWGFGFVTGSLRWKSVRLEVTVIIRCVYRMYDVKSVLILYKIYFLFIGCWCRYAICADASGNS